MRSYLELIVSDTISIRGALAALERSGEKILLICDLDHKLLGVLSDGDLRKSILKEINYDSGIKDLYNRNPVCFQEGYDVETVMQKMIDLNITCIPIIGQDGHLLDAITWNRVFDKTINIKKKSIVEIPVVIMAGGKGSRLAPFTDVLPKPLIPINGKPIIEVIIEQFLEYDVKKFFVTLNYKKEIIKAYFGYMEYQNMLSYIEEDDFWGTAGSLKLLPNDIDDNFIVTNCDVLLNIDYSELVQFHELNNYDITIVGCEQKHIIPYGVISLNGSELASIDEKPQMDIITNTGIYVVNKQVLSEIPNDIVFHMTDLMTKVQLANKRVGVFMVTEDKWKDMGQWNEYRKSIDSLIQERKTMEG